MDARNRAKQMKFVWFTANSEHWCYQSELTNVVPLSIRRKNPLPNLCFTGGTAILPDRTVDQAVVICRNGEITYVGQSKSRIPKSAKIIDAKGGWISPGFIDIHVHGGGGSDFMDGSLEAVHQSCRTHAKHGTTTLFPTTTTGSPKQIQAMLDASTLAQQTWNPENGAAIGGVHLYGPFFAKDKVGCHSPSGRRRPTKLEYESYFDSGIVKVATCAAELPGAAEFYQLARRKGCLVTCGHSNSSWAEMDVAFKNGMRHVDHFWCAMSTVPSIRKRLGVPMQGSMLEYVLGNPEMSTEVIADGMHLSPELLRFAWQLKTASRLCLVTDCNRALDMPPGKYRFGPQQNGSWFTSDGKVGWASKDALASSVSGMAHMVRHMHHSTGIPITDVVRMASLTPAERVGMDARIGSLQRGKQADILVLSPRLKIRGVFLKGNRFPISGRR